MYRAHSRFTWQADFMPGWYSGHKLPSLEACLTLCIILLLLATEGFTVTLVKAVYPATTLYCTVDALPL